MCRSFRRWVGAGPGATGCGWCPGCKGRTPSGKSPSLVPMCGLEPRHRLPGWPVHGLGFVFALTVTASRARPSGRFQRPPRATLGAVQGASSGGKSRQRSPLFRSHVSLPPAHTPGTGCRHSVPGFSRCLSGGFFGGLDDQPVQGAAGQPSKPDQRRHAGRSASVPEIPNRRPRHVDGGGKALVRREPMQGPCVIESRGIKADRHLTTPFALAVQLPAPL